jgi:hypothetical protein
LKVQKLRQLEIDRIREFHEVLLFFFHQLGLVNSKNIHHHQLGLVSEEVLAP